MASLMVGATGAVHNQKPKSEAERIFARAKADDFVGDETCAGCHAERAANFVGSAHAAYMKDSHLPLDKRGCEGCHGAGQIHQADENPEVVSFRKMTPKEASLACLRCHQSTLSESHWKRTEHARANISCVSCHQIHPDSDPELPKGTVATARFWEQRLQNGPAVETKSLLKADQATLCGSCHAKIAAQGRLLSHHPIPEGRMECSDCHELHPTQGQKVTKLNDRDQCVKCHSDFAGPFLYEHDPVAGHTSSGCSECHNPHGSQNASMLKSSSRGLCASCHTDKLSGHYPGQTCWTAGCHVASHGSNTDPRFLKP